MSRRPARFTQADVARAIRAYEQVHGKEATVEILPDGTLRVIPLETARQEGSAKFFGPVEAEKDLVF